MKVVYVGDNRNRGNFGCRATSTALSQLIEINNEIVGVVSGRYTNNDPGELFYYKYLPSFIYRWLGKRNNWILYKKVFYLFFRYCRKGRQYIFSNFDYLSYDLDLAIHNYIKCLPANPHLQEFDLRQYEFDALVVNGEGSFIFRIPAWRECVNELMLMHWAQKMGKKVFYMNGMLSDDPFTERNMEIISVVKPIFAKSQIVGVRENDSLSYAKKYFNDSNIKLYPDALFTWYDYVNDDFQIKNGRYITGMSGATNSSYTDFDFTHPYICISASSSIGLASKNINETIEQYVRLVNKVKDSFTSRKIYLVIVCEGDDFLNKVGMITNTDIIPIDTPILSAAKILANADAYISGRYHPSILASLGGTPCVFMSSNSHKTKSLQDLLEYDYVHEYNVIPSDDEINQMIKQTTELINQGSKLRCIIKSRCEVLSLRAKQMSDDII